MVTNRVGQRQSLNPANGIETREIVKHSKIHEFPFGVTVSKTIK